MIRRKPQPEPTTWLCRAFGVNVGIDLVCTLDWGHDSLHQAWHEGECIAVWMRHDPHCPECAPGGGGPMCEHHAPREASR